MIKCKMTGNDSIKIRKLAYFRHTLSTLLTPAFNGVNFPETLLKGPALIGPALLGPAIIGPALVRPA